VTLTRSSLSDTGDAAERLAPPPPHARRESWRRWRSSRVSRSAAVSPSAARWRARRRPRSRRGRARRPVSVPSRLREHARRAGRAVDVDDRLAPSAARGPRAGRAARAVTGPRASASADSAPTCTRRGGMRRGYCRGTLTPGHVLDSLHVLGGPRTPGACRRRRARRRSAASRRRTTCRRRRLDLLVAPPA
jgi:hypothetical protein